MRARAVCAGLLLASPCAAAWAQAPIPIRDNSFLIEEAYNQEWGVVQHVFTYQQVRGSGAWGGSFTQEWPVPSERHQLSYTIPVDRSIGGRLDVPQLALNYRYQIPMRAGSRLAIAPRFSLTREIDGASAGESGGSFGAGVNLPVSVELSRLFVTHFNVGANWMDGGMLFSPSESFIGSSLVFLFHPKLNFMVEALLTADGGVAVLGDDLNDGSFHIAPGFRGAIDFPSGLQIVPGIAFPIGVGRSEGEKGVYLYLSFEHPFRRR